jgi:acetyl-CoA C-acetyltransferase
MAKPPKGWGKPGELADTAIGWRFTNPRFTAQERTTYSMPETAEHLGQMEGISRQQADGFALASHQRAVAATRAGRFAPELVALTPPGTGQHQAKEQVDDEGPRPDTSAAALAGLRPVVRGGSLVTAGNSSPLNDGAAALVLASPSAVDRYSLKPIGTILGGAAAGVAPEVMGLGPVPATTKLLNRLGMTVKDLAAVELNEAFATQALACMARLDLNQETTNAWGGAIALGHPLGASGARITTTLLNRLAQSGGGLGLATACVGVGQGMALAVEV